MVTKKHKYLGVWYKAGASFKDEAHKEWACSPVRNYGDRKKVAAKPAKIK